MIKLADPPRTSTKLGDGDAIASFDFVNEQSAFGFGVIGNGQNPQASNAFWVDENGLAVSDQVFGPDEYNQECDVNLKGDATSSLSVPEVSEALRLSSTTKVFSSRPIDDFNGTSLSIAMWVKCPIESDVPPSTYTLLSYMVPEADEGFNEFVLSNPSSLTLLIKGSKRHPGIESKISFCDEDWHHLAVTWRSTDGRVKIYKDGITAFEAGPYKSNRGGIQPGGSLVVGALQKTSCYYATNQTEEPYW